MKNPFHYRNNRLFCEDVDLLEFSRFVPSPFYLYSQAEIEYNCDSVWEAAKGINFQPFYALKANYNPAILKLILNKKFGADIVSGGELFFARKAGYSPEKIVFAGVGKSDQEIEQALNENIHSINIESEDELQRLEGLAQQLGRKQRIAIRINPDIEAKTHPYISTGLHSNKFGISAQKAFDLYIKAAGQKHLLAEGIHVHIGSQIIQDGPYLETAEFLKDFIKQLATRSIEIKYLDLGGGIGIDYENAFADSGSPRTYLSEILRKYLQAFADLNIMLFAELGRSIVGSAAVLVSKVLLKKETPLKKFSIVDAAMNNLIRPSLYQAKHAIVPLVINNKPGSKTDIVGPVCESSDFFAKEYEIQDLSRGDYIAIGSAGAYAQALASNYNLRPTIAEYLVNGSEIKCIAKRKSIEDIAANFEW
jgi:diaminopimelate decarboxylase